MKAIGLFKYLPIEDEQSFVDVTLDQPVPKGRDLLVKVHAISVNPVDTKVRAPNNEVETEPRILGWDAAGEVTAIGNEVEHYAIGDRVFYAGDLTRSGSNAEYQLVDEQIVGHMPKTIGYAEAAALPLTSITAWEALFERLQISKTGADEGKSILIISGAGGVGSIAIQLAKKVAKLHVIATASRPASINWAKARGADKIINHRNSLDDELKKIGISQVDYILCLNSTEKHWAAMANAIVPQGRIASIVETEPVDLSLLQSKSATFVWELMFTRSMYQTPDMIEQQHLLNEIAMLVDRGEIISTMNEVIRPISASNLRIAHRLIEQGDMIGKVVLADWA
ncbi:MAG: zinc-binding alcohol dehydrogenase family protein [Opitutae bacterium]|nr:zinc-binding alcohol dehydrogenase family protein [Opitutae bacterium]